MEEERAMGFEAEGDAKMISSKGFMSRLFGSQSKIEEACELYARAANSYKMAKKWNAAGDAFAKVAAIQLNTLQSKHEAATQYVEAANCYRKTDFEAAITSLKNAIEQFTDMGRFSIAAKHHFTVAEIYETNIVDVEKAIVNYTAAADYYKGEESTSSANKCMLKVAMLAAQEEDYQKAVALYEEVAATSLESSLLKYSAREYFFKASLCHMCMDMDAAKSAVEKYCQMFPAFEDSREMKLLNALIEAKEAEDKELFTEAVREYDAISRLDQWLTAILVRIKKTVGDDDFN